MRTITQPARAARGRDQRGAIAVWMSVALVAVIVILGIAVDFSGHARATQEAQGLAAEAARAGGQHLDISSGQARLATRQAVAAADNYVASASGWTGSVSIESPTMLRVDVVGTYECQFLSIIGINSLRVEGTGLADVKSTVAGSER